MIEAFRVGAVSRGRPLWDGLTLSVAGGEMWVVTGPPSSGKTLLLQILRGERRPDSGDVHVSGKSLYRDDPAHNRKFRASSGVVPECLSPEEGRTVADLFRLSSLVAGGVSPSERKGRTEELLAMVGLPETEETKVARLSVSERARMALAVELFRSPDYLFLDMLLENSGQGWADRLGAILRALAKGGRTILLAERRLPEKWQAGRIPPPASAEPFRLYRLTGPSPERKGGTESPPPGEDAPLPMTAREGE